MSYDSLDCLATLWRFQGHNGVYFCGSYAICGMPLLETAVSSAVQISTTLGSICPWQHRLGDVRSFSPLSLPPPPQDFAWTTRIAFILFIIVAIIIISRIL